MEITSAEFVISNTDVKKCPTGVFPEYAFIGRSNVGKSSPYQYADCPQRTGDDLRHTGKDNAYQPLPDQPKLVPGRSSPDTATPDADKKEKTRYVPSSKTTSSNGNR